MIEKTPKILRDCDNDRVTVIPRPSRLRRTHPGLVLLRLLDDRSGMSRLTVDQARELARMLTAAADEMDPPAAKPEAPEHAACRKRTPAEEAACRKRTRVQLGVSAEEFAEALRGAARIMQYGHEDHCTTAPDAPSPWTKEELGAAQAEYNRVWGRGTFSGPARRPVRLSQQHVGMEVDHKNHAQYEFPVGTQLAVQNLAGSSARVRLVPLDRPAIMSPVVWKSDLMVKAASHEIALARYQAYKKFQKIHGGADAKVHIQVVDLQSGLKQIVVTLVPR